jgi:hypothetical protein
MKDKKTDFQADTLPGLIKKLIAGIDILMCVYHVYTGYFGAPQALVSQNARDQSSRTPLPG